MPLIVHTGRSRARSETSRTNPSLSGNAKRGTRKVGKRNDSSGSVMLYRGRSPTQSEVTTKDYASKDIDLIIVDESNSFSSKNDDRRRYLTIVCTRVRDRERYAKVVGLVPYKKGKRSKYSGTTEKEVEKIIKGLAEQDYDIVECHDFIDYDGLDTPEKKKCFYLGVLRKAVTYTVELDGRETDVILDTPPIPMNEELVRFCEELVKSGHKIRWFETRCIAADKYLTIHDFETGFVSESVEGLEPGTGLRTKYWGKKVRNVE